MTLRTTRLTMMFVVAMMTWLVGSGRLWQTSGYWISAAEARVGMPATPISYAGVARRTTVRAVTPGVGAGQVGVGYSGGVGVNLGGPVNRVGVR